MLFYGIQIFKVVGKLKKMSISPALWEHFFNFIARFLPLRPPPWEGSKRQRGRPNSRSATYR